MLDGLLDVFHRPRKVPPTLELPRGRYEIIGSRCHVRIEAKDFPRRSRFFARLLMMGRLMERVELVRQRETDLTASIGLEGIAEVTPRDFLTEQATLWVEDEYGRCRRLPMEGTSQLSLVRQHLDGDREVLFTADFTAGGNAAGLQRSGFSGAENGHTWTEAAVVTVVLPCAVRPGERYELGLNCWPFMPPALHAQRMTVDVGGRLKTIVADRNSLRFSALRFEGGDFDPSDHVRIEFRISDPGRPSDYGDSGDGRLLGFAFKEIVWSRLVGD